MSAESILAVARARALTRMVDSCAISRPDVRSGSADPVTGLPTLTPGASVFSGSCFLEVTRVQNPGATGVGGDFPVVEHLTLKLPPGVVGLQVQDVVVLTSAPDHSWDVGRRYRVTSLNTGSQLKAQSAQVELIVG